MNSENVAVISVSIFVRMHPQSGVAVSRESANGHGHYFEPVMGEVQTHKEERRKQCNNGAVFPTLRYSKATLEGLPGTKDASI